MNRIQFDISAFATLQATCGEDMSTIGVLH